MELGQGLVEYDEIRHIFKTTTKGIQVLQLQNQINEEFDPIDDDRKRRVAVELH